MAQKPSAHKAACKANDAFQIQTHLILQRNTDTVPRASIIIYVNIAHTCILRTRFCSCLSKPSKAKPAVGDHAADAMADMAMAGIACGIAGIACGMANHGP